MLAKDIKDCSDCPLYPDVCKGGIRSGWGGEMVESPCHYWDDDDEIYEEKYLIDWDEL